MALYLGENKVCLNLGQSAKQVMFYSTAIGVIAVLDSVVLE